MTKQFYENYWQSEPNYLSDFHLKWPKLKKFIPLQAGVSIVDFGCGNGKILSEIYKINPQANLTGLDVSQAAINQAKRRLPGVKFYKINDGGLIPLEDGSVDFIFSSEVIEHVYDTENAFTEFSRILKPGGRILLTTPYHGLIKNILIALLSFDRHFNPTGAHIRFFTKKSLFDILKKYKLQIIKYGYYGRFWPIPHSIYVLAEKR